MKVSTLFDLAGTSISWVGSTLCIAGNSVNDEDPVVEEDELRMLDEEMVDTDIFLLLLITGEINSCFSKCDAFCEEMV